MILEDDDFATIVAAVEQGRGTFLNVRRFLTYHLTDNVAELFPLLVWALFLSPRPVLRLHPFLRALVEVLIYVAVTLAWWSIGQAWVGLAFAVVAVTSGVIAGRRSLG